MNLLGKTGDRNDAIYIYTYMYVRLYLCLVARSIAPGGWQPLKYNMLLYCFRVHQH